MTDDEILDLLVNKKWFDSIFSGINDLYTAISHCLTSRIIELAERYENTLPELDKETIEYEAKVKSHPENGFRWKEYRQAEDPQDDADADDVKGPVGECDK